MAAIDMGLAETLVPGTSSSGDDEPARGTPVQRRSGIIDAPGLLAGRYQVSRFVGAGAFGLVYEATDARLQKTVAVKLLGADRMRRPDALARFRAEALAASRLSHPYIVTVTDFDVLEDGRAFLVMEYVAGSTLADYRWSCAMPPTAIGSTCITPAATTRVMDTSATSARRCRSTAVRSSANRSRWARRERRGR